MKQVPRRRNALPNFSQHAVRPSPLWTFACRPPWLHTTVCSPASFCLPSCSFWRSAWYMVAPQCKHACTLSNNVLFFVWCKLQMYMFSLFCCELKHLYNPSPYIYSIALWWGVIWWETHFSCVNNTQQYSQNVELFFLIPVDGALFLFCYDDTMMALLLPSMILWGHGFKV